MILATRNIITSFLHLSKEGHLKFAATLVSYKENNYQDTNLAASGINVYGDQMVDVYSKTGLCNTYF